MLLKRFFKRARTRSFSDTNKQTCLCTAAKRDSLYDDQYGFTQADKPRRLIRQKSVDESEGEDDMGITEKLRCSSVQYPANIPMLVVVSFKPDGKNLQKNQIEIHRGFPINAQYLLNEWLFIKTADNDEGFVPYLCCRPMFRRQPIKENSSLYKPHNFQSTNHSSSSYLVKKRHDITSSSCAGDSGVSDCESSSNNYQNFDLSKRLLRSSLNTFKKTGLIVQDLPGKKTLKINQMKSHLSVSSNSAFTQIVKKTQRQESNQNQSIQHEQQMSSAFKTNSRRPYESFDETKNLSMPSSKYLTDKISSPYIRRTPYARRSLPHNNQSIFKTATSDSFKRIKGQQLRNIVLAEPSFPPAIIPTKSTLEKHFSDLSLNQIENDSLSPSTPHLLGHNQPSLSCSSSSSSTTSSSTDDSTTPFIHIQMNNYRTGRIPVLYASSNINNNSNTSSTKSNSFIHNVSITV